MTSLVGRERELTSLADLLRDPGVRLITLIGHGGVGKTRLGLRLATDVADLDRFTDGAVVVELAAVRDPNHVVPAIAQTFGLRLSPHEPVFTSLKCHLSSLNLLLIFDNIEQVIDAGRQIAELPRSCPRLTVLVTSRARLLVSGEHAVIVPRLAAGQAALASPRVEPAPTSDFVGGVWEPAFAKVPSE